MAASTEKKGRSARSSMAYDFQLCDFLTAPRNNKSEMFFAQ